MTRSRQLIKSAHRPRTQITYHTQFKLYMAFAVFMDIQNIQDVQFIIGFLTLLFDNGLSPPTISGYVAALKHAFVLYGLNQAVIGK